MSILPGSLLTASPQDPIRVLIVEDSGVIRAFLRKFIEEDPSLKVTATAANGQKGVDAVHPCVFDVVVLDIEMPVMDGLTALPLILRADPALHVIVASTLTKENALMSMRCLEAGAAECLAKPSAQEISGSSMFRESLVSKVKTLGLATRRRRLRGGAFAVAPRLEAEAARPSELRPVVSPAPRVEAPAQYVLRKEVLRMTPDVIAIGSSTGGPQALLKFFADLKRPVPQPILITQHMPPTFTTILAEHIAKNSGLACHEAVEGEVVEGGVIYLAPGNFHMTVRAEGLRRVISLNQDAPENFCRPAADPMLRSLVKIYGRKILAVIFTGMGADGMKGCQEVVDAGGTVLAQDEASSIVWGMPGAVTKAGLVTRVLPLDQMAAEVREYADRMGARP